MSETHGVNAFGRMGPDAWALGLRVHGLDLSYPALRPVVKSCAERLCSELKHVDAGMGLAQHAYI